MRRFLLVVIALVATVAAAGGVLYWRVEAPFRGYDAAERFVEIPSGAGPGVIGRRLIDAGVVRDRLTWRLALLQSGAARELKAGEYRFAEPATAPQVVARLARGDVYLRPITFPEGWTVAEMATLYEARGFGTGDSFQRAARDASLIHRLDPAAPDLEGYLFPETYGLPRRTEAGVLVRQMAARFEQTFGPELRREALAHAHSVREVVTLASLVEKETARPEERPIVAAVYWNRLKIGMGLQCDPTVIYALRKAGRYSGNLTREDLAYDSPYNTYRYAGLPPGPIGAPGRASLEAATRPASVDYLYFVSRNDGSHVFSRTYEEHRRNVQQYQVEPFKAAGEHGPNK
jgi:UPF0755 protein